MHPSTIISKRNVLVVVPSGGAAFDGTRVLIDSKANAGLSLYAKLWPGRVLCLYRSVDPAQMSYAQWCEIERLPFELVPLAAEADAAAVAEWASNAALVLASADNHRDLGLVDALPDTKVVFVIEYTLRTRIDILWLEGGRIVQRLTTLVWLLMTERKRRRALARAAGMQANGTPAFGAYGRSNALPFLFFDTRLGQKDFIGSAAAASKSEALTDRAPLSLVYSGRLEKMKGADYLVPIAAALKQRGRAKFVLHIFGSGSLATSMASDIATHHLESHVVLHGPIDFDTQLIPFLKSSADIFLCCHPQGDPACTYLETLGCGVPIVGFRNEAFAGVVTLGNCGEAVKIGDRNAMVAAIERLDADRELLAELTRGAAEVASNRLFEDTFSGRVKHLVAVAALPDVAAGSVANSLKRG